MWEFYGSTEGQFTACSPRGVAGATGHGRSGAARHAGSTSTPTASSGARVPPYARFEYWRDPGKTAAAWRGDAFTVGDLGRLDDDGYLFLDGRRDDLIITGGVNVYPAEVERCSSVRRRGQVAVFGADDERWGQRVCAAVVGPRRLAPVLQSPADLRRTSAPRRSSWSKTCRAGHGQAAARSAARATRAHSAGRVICGSRSA